MQQIYLSTRAIPLLFSFLPLCLMAQTFVKQDATGNNDGSSWEHAYTDLSLALDSTQSGEIWVAAGTYFPGSGSPDSLSSFSIRSSVALYGGFAGTETNLADRDLQNNPTILSGDILGNDVAEDFDNNKLDNVQHVVYVDSLLSTIIIDGFTVSGGHTSNINTQSEFFWRGGGIFSYSTIEVSNCIFSNNFGRSGGGIYISPNGGNGGSGSSFTNCIFSYNFSSTQGSGLFLQLQSDIEVENCTFSNNRGSRGAFYPLDCTDILINNSLFDSNQDQFIDGFGAAFFNWQSTGITLSNTTFKNNVSGNGACIYHDGREAAMSLDNLIIDNCVFENNQATDWGGGAIYVWRGSFEIRNSTFTNNRAPSTGAHLHSGGEDKRVIISNNIFEQGQSGWGAGHSCYGGNSIYTISNNTYQDNTAMTSGGAIINGFLANITIDSCSFQNNAADWGGAIYNQNDSTTVSILRSSFVNNQSTNFGGAINYAGGIFSEINQCMFESNTSNIGGAISFTEGEAANDASFVLANSIFNFNLAATQAGALNLGDVDATISSCLFTNSINTGTGAGGAISNNASDSNSVVVNILNTTFADNAAVLGAGIAQWTGTIDASAMMTLQNCIFDNPDGANYDIEDGLPTLLSNGGNLANSNDIEDFFTHETDLLADPMFVDRDNFDFRLMEMSPAIDAGVSEGAPEFDLDGNPRVGNIDIGAYEFQIDVDAPEVLLENNGQLTAFPNPFKDELQFELNNDWKGPLEIRLNNVLGQEVRTWKMEKHHTLLSSRLSIPSLNSGVYYLLISNGEQLISISLNKL